MNILLAISLRFTSILPSKILTLPRFAVEVSLASKDFSVLKARISPLFPISAASCSYMVCIVQYGMIILISLLELIRLPFPHGGFFM